MSQIIIDDQLRPSLVLAPILRWITAQRLRNLRPTEVIKDERVPQLLRELRQPTFVTIDAHFWDKSRRDSRYCILYFDLRTEQQAQLPGLLRRLFRFPDFKTKKVRMGKVAKVGFTDVEYWQLGDELLQTLAWK